MKKVIMALTWGAVFAAALTGTGCVRHWDDDHGERHERYEHHDDDRRGGHERSEHRS
ncbi:MAG: hypothetical protein CDV28_10263 [Candidatus Electronema aureum]|uniref:Lipoprotein n=1 Tax=Candidatus Electronema aureum TaxID=2005002 RepID=A0A521G4Y1_9BACT|nr:MAG: hypothetical protein CDV28_10263 [Candidatus Electronema aureum]